MQQQERKEREKLTTEQKEKDSHTSSSVEHSPDPAIEQAETSPSHDEASSRSRGEIIKDVGLVDQEGVDELCSKIAGLTPEGVWETLRNGTDKHIKIAYQLVRDSRGGGIDRKLYFVLSNAISADKLCLARMMPQKQEQSQGAETDAQASVSI